MALNGYTSIKVTNWDTLKFSWERTSYSIPNNTTTIAWKMELIATSSGRISSSSSRDWSVTVNGEKYSGTNNISIANNATKTLASGSTVIKHNNDGSKSFSYSFSQEFGITFSGSSIGTKSGSGTGTLEPLPRAAAITNATDFTDESAPVVTFTNLAGYQVRPYLNFLIDGEIKHTILRVANYYTSPYSWSFSADEITELLQVVKSVNSCRVIVGLDTYNDSAAHIGNSQLTKTFTVVNAQPTLAPVVVDTNEAAKALTGNGKTIIKHFNTVSAAAGATTYKAATLSALKIINGGNTLYSDGSFTNTADNTFIFKVQDSRGNTAEQTVTLPMIEYIPLTVDIEGKIALNSTDGTKANIEITVKGNYFKGSFGAVSNTLDIRYSVKSNGAEVFGEYLELPDSAFNDGKYEITYTVPYDFNYKGIYEVSVNAIDKVNTSGISNISKKLQAIPIFNWYEDRFNFNVPITIDNVEMDYIVEQGNKDGWSYRKWASGVGECWKTVTVNTAINQAWGSMYVGGTKMARQNYPFVFETKPVETATLLNGNYSVWLYTVGNGDGVNGAYASAVYNVCRPDAVSTSGTYYINLYAFGKWR